MNRRIDKIDPKEWQSIINAEAKECAPKTLKNAWGFIRTVIHEETGDFPPEVRIPAQVHGNKPFLLPEQITAFVEAVKKTQYAIPCYLALHSLRASEIEGLRWENIPINPDFITVSGAVVLTKRWKKNKTRVVHQLETFP